MKKIDADDALTKSADVIASHFDQVKTLFPEAIKEDKVDFEVLKQLLGGAIEEREEKYGLNWHGKRRARQMALTPSTGTLRPCPEESVDWDATQNLIIEGDNLEVLKLLQKSYAGKVKLIYIDPPYNTGKDFVYPDNFRDNIRNYLELTGQLEGSRKISSNTEASGRFHTDWLNMIYPRITLSRALLRQDGFIFVSIDDDELHHMRLLLNEIFGEENFAATLVLDRNRKNDAKLFSVGHEYMVVIARNKQLLSELDVRLRAPKEGVDEVRAEFEKLRMQHGDDWAKVAIGMREYYSSFTADDPRQPMTRFTKFDDRGPYRTDGDISWPGGGGPRYEVLHPVSKRPCKIPVSGWRYPTPERFKEEVKSGNIVFGPDETTVPSARRNLFEKDDQVMRSVTFSYAQKATNDFAKIFDGEKVFDNPKSIVDLERIIDYTTDAGDVILDFFAGSGTTAHAALLVSQKKATARHCILVQLPEPLDASNKDQKVAAEFCRRNNLAGNLAEICKERVRRAARTIRANNPMFSGDTGFRVFKLDTSNIREWDPNRDDIAGTLEKAVEHLKTDRNEQDVLIELLLKLGLELTVPIEEKKIAGKTVYNIGVGTLIACLDSKIAAKEVEKLANGIAAWHKELAPAGETVVVFRDSAFADDVAKTNLTAILEQAREDRPMIIRSL
jgi:adenine-specific DNA-methyltransferase